MSKPSIILRIDDRLIHGQVLIGWGTRYPIKHFIVGDDEIAESDWEKNLLLMAVPPEFDARVYTIDQSRAYIEENLNSSELSMVLVSSPFQIEQMAEKGLPLRQINVGGIHFKEGRKEFLPYLFLNEKEVAAFKNLISKGYSFECQDVPSGMKYDLEKILQKG